MNRSIWRIPALFGLTAVVLGAFGAHTLRNFLSPEQIQTFETGIRYQFYHTFALLFIALAAEKLPATMMKYCRYFFTAGILLFSGSLYLLACAGLLHLSNHSWLGPVTPLGGLCFIIGWGILLIAGFKKEDK